MMRLVWLAARLAAMVVWPVAALAQNPLATLPNNYRSIFENGAVTVIRAHYGAHEKIPVHDHTSFSTVFVYLSDSGPVRIDHAEENEKPVSVIRPPTVKGSYRVAAGMVERHSIENLGDTSSDFLRVELKQVALRLKEPFRGKAPESLATGVDAIEFSEPDLEIERIICVGPSPCAVKAAAAPSLIVVFGPLSLKTAGKTEKPDNGVVRWLPAGQAAQIAAEAGTPAHLLRILLPAPAK